MKRILLVGYGDIARRTAELLIDRYRVYGLLRDAGARTALQSAGVVPVPGDLDFPPTLSRLPGIADIVVHLAPPQRSGDIDLRTRHLLAALSRPRRFRTAGKASHREAAKMLPQRLVYISTSGVYGDCGGERVAETRPLRPATPRAVRRADAEQCVRHWGARCGVPVSILRVPGIYAADRLPLERLHDATPALRRTDDVFSSHIHADDLARIIAHGMLRMRPGRTYNCVDRSELRMGDYFDLVADAARLPRPPRVSREKARLTLPPERMSFLEESRRLDGQRLMEELRVGLRYPTVESALDDIVRQRDATGTRPAAV